MAAEDFTTYTEVEDTDATITITSSKIDANHIDRDEDNRVYIDKGSAHFDGDFDHLLDVTIQSVQTFGSARVWGMSNNDNAEFGNDCLFFYINVASGPTITLKLREKDGATAYSDESAEVSTGTTYYCRIKRDESVGTYGTLYCGIYTTRNLAEAGDATDGDFDNLSVTLHSSKRDFQYLYALNSSNTATGGRQVDVDIENYDLQEDGGGGGSIVPLVAAYFRRMRNFMVTMAGLFGRLV